MAWPTISSPSPSRGKPRDGEGHGRLPKNADGGWKMAEGRGPKRAVSILHPRSSIFAPSRICIHIPMRRRSGFTLVELLVVISILLVLSTVVWAVFKPSNTEKMRSAARIAQSAFLGAKDRALHAKDLRG